MARRIWEIQNGENRELEKRRVEETVNLEDLE